MMQHYHTSSNLSRKLDVLLKYLQLQVGTNKHPLTLDYIKWGHLATLSWTKMLWRSFRHHNIDLYMKYKEIPPPRENDILVVEVIKIMARLPSKTAVQSLNRCHCHLSLLFLSDLATADGKYIKQILVMQTVSSQDINSQEKYPHKQTGRGGISSGRTLQLCKRLPIQHTELGDGSTSRTLTIFNGKIKTNYNTINVKQEQQYTT